jgi:hypothetical protein
VRFRKVESSKYWRITTDEREYVDRSMAEAEATEWFKVFKAASPVLDGKVFIHTVMHGVDCPCVNTCDYDFGDETSEVIALFTYSPESSAAAEQNVGTSIEVVKCLMRYSIKQKCAIQPDHSECVPITQVQYDSELKELQSERFVCSD